MTEHDALGRVEGPQTVESLTTDLQTLGIERGDVLLVHSSLSALGWVCGGPVAVVQALINVVGHEGTLVMPTHSSQNSDPSFWENPPVPDTWWPTIRETMPAYDPHLTPTRNMGAIAEVFRTHPDARRSAHPEVSFAAIGAHRDEIIDDHGLDYPMGDDSPLARIYNLDGRVLLLGVGHANNTSLHLAEYRSEWSESQVRRGAAMLIRGEREWVTYEDVDTDPSDFGRIGKAFERRPNNVITGQVGAAQARLMSQTALVDFASDWMDRNRVY